MSLDCYVERDWVAKTLEDLTSYYSKLEFENTGTISLRDFIKPVLKKDAKKSRGVKFPYDNKIDSILLKEAREYINKSIYCFFAYKYLQMGGYLARSMDTFYYSRFYLNNYLCRLQGQAIIHYRPQIQISRIDWDKKYLLIRKCPGKGGIHERIWDLTKASYQYFKPDKPLSANENLIGVYFNNEWWERVKLTAPKHEDYKKRIEHTYDLFGFDELYYAPGHNYPISGAKKDGKINYIDKDVFSEIANQEYFDGRGVEEAGLGDLLKFAIELAGHINSAMTKKVITISKHNLELLKTNENTKQLIFKWIKEADI